MYQREADDSAAGALDSAARVRDEAPWEEPDAADDDSPFKLGSCIPLYRSVYLWSPWTYGLGPPNRGFWISLNATGLNGLPTAYKGSTNAWG